MSTIRVYLDGKVFVPDEPIKVPKGAAAQVIVIPSAEPLPLATDPAPLAELAAILEAMPDTSKLPTDYAAELDHYLYGTPKHGE